MVRKNKLKNAKGNFQKRKKTRQVQGLGTKVDSEASYSACLVPRNSRRVKRNSNPDASIEEEVDDISNGAIMCNLRDGRDIPFWYGCWADSKPLMILFPNFYVVAKEDGIYVADSGLLTPAGWQWQEDCILRPTRSGSAAVLSWKQLMAFIDHSKP
ncbi:uncharacterized protein LOC131602400 [Vicia villosa]|uniref:uncharacterized protein LOC131602400 n=1 Tax=Vicia villosa TaxID=3911 RepID=UPI00273ADF30|nr:uncharacterized protein LOC131602400 [Vicia villosa]